MNAIRILLLSRELAAMVMYIFPSFLFIRLKVTIIFDKLAEIKSIKKYLFLVFLADVI